MRQDGRVDAIILTVADEDEENLEWKGIAQTVKNLLTKVLDKTNSKVELVREDLREEITSVKKEIN